MKQRNENGIFVCSIIKNGKLEGKSSKFFDNQEQLDKYFLERINHYKAEEKPELTTTSSFGCHGLFKYAKDGIDKHQQKVDIEYVANFTPRGGCIIR